MNLKDFDISDLIINSLENYDKKNKKYKKYIENSKIIYKDNETKNEFTLVNKNNNDEIKLKTKYETLGIFDYQTKIWTWAWLLPNLPKNQTTIAKKLLEYGLTLEPKTNSEDHFYIKSQLLNSRFTIENDIELDIHLAVSTYLIKDLYSFIYSQKIYTDTKLIKFYIIYYLII